MVVSTRADSSKGKDTDLAFIYQKIERYIRVFGRRVKNKDMDFRIIFMMNNTLVNSRMVLKMEMGF